MIKSTTADVCISQQVEWTTNVMAIDWKPNVCIATIINVSYVPGKKPICRKDACNGNNK